MYLETSFDTLQLPNPLEDPLTILILQVIIATAGVVVAFFVATYRGEMAATKFSINETRRRDHALRLIEKALESIKESLTNIELILGVRPKSSDELTIGKMDIHKMVYPEKELLLKHLETGYEQLYGMISNYQETYNKLADSSLVIYNKAIQTLKDACKEETLGFSVDIKYARTIEAFSGGVTSQLAHSNSSKLARYARDNHVWLGSYDIVARLTQEQGEKLAKAINSLFQDPEIFGQLEQIWKDAQPLIEDRNRIKNEINMLKTYVEAGVHLEGSCQAGMKAGYEKA